jgi:proteic killer suppression protein
LTSVALQATIAPMITGFRHKGLERFWTDNDRKKLPADQINKIDRILDLLDEIEELPKDLLPFPGLAIHSLKGNLAGFWSVRVTGNYRIIFRLDGKNVSEIDYIDYH